jgi:tRNA U34 5-carboxymethylaminomethyl modifying GTPase MnmE/TrmE
MTGIQENSQFIAFSMVRMLRWNQVVPSVGEVVRKTTTEDLLDSIFSQFCIGK